MCCGGMFYGSLVAMRLVVVLLGLLFCLNGAHAATAPGYDIGLTPVMTQLYVNPATGSDSNAGTSRSSSVRSLARAWQMVPNARTSATGGYQINLAAGNYPDSLIPNYWELKQGIKTAPVIITTDSQTTGRATILGAVNMYSCSYIYFINVDINSPFDPLHFELCNYMLVRGCTMQAHGNDADTYTAQETVKANQCTFLYIEESDISKASDNAIDFVAVQGGHVIRNKIHGAADWCMYTKGGSANILVAENEIYDCGTGGYTAGQGTGFQYMVQPWLYYEAMHIRFVNNIVRNTWGAAVGVNGGYNILLAHNTFYNCGPRSHGVEFVFGSRSCDADSISSKCASYNSLGGWGPTRVTFSDSDVAFIGNKNIYFYNNILYNNGVQSQWQHLAIYNPISMPSGLNAPNPARTDDNLQIRGNVFWNGPPDLPLGNSDQACIDSNPTCNTKQLLTDNAFNTMLPVLVNPAGGNFRLPAGSNVYTAKTFAIPSFAGNGLPNPACTGNLNTSVLNDRDGNNRFGVPVAGAYVSSQVLPPTSQCTALPTANATFTHNCTVAAVGSNCTVQCAQNSTIFSTYSCVWNATTITAQWLGTLPICSTSRPLVTCNTLTGAPGQYNTTQCSAGKTSCVVSCASGWVGISVSLVCNNGQWSGTLPVCVRPCSRLTGLASTLNSTACGDGALPGSNCTVSCAGGMLPNSTVYTCYANVTTSLWTGTPPTCKPVPSCGALNVGIGRTGCSAGSRVGAICTINCATGYTLLLGTASTYMCTLNSSTSTASWVQTSSTQPLCALNGQASAWSCKEATGGFFIAVRVSADKKIQCNSSGASQDCIWYPRLSSCIVPTSSTASSLTCSASSLTVPGHWCNTVSSRLTL